MSGVTGRTAETDPQSSDPRLRGRTYAISFDRVWSAALALASGGAPRWALISEDDQAGLLVATTRTLISRRVGDAWIDIGLDDYGQTRVDVRVVMRGQRGDLGAAARIVGAFVRALDLHLQARPEQILDAARVPTWSS